MVDKKIYDVLLRIGACGPRLLTGMVSNLLRQDRARALKLGGGV